MKPFLGESISGNPRDILHCCIAWYSGTFTERRKNFPSWSWTGWQYALDENSFWFDSARPYLDLFSVKALPMFRLSINSSRKYKLVVERVGLKPAGSARPLQNLEVRDSKMISDVRKELGGKLEEIWVMDRPLLAFYTSIGRLQLRRSERIPQLKDSLGYRISSDDLRTFDIWTCDSRKMPITINLTTSQSGIIRRTNEFIAIQFHPSKGFRLLMIEWENGIAYRVQLANDYVSMDTWSHVVDLTSKLIIIG